MRTVTFKSVLNGVAALMGIVAEQFLDADQTAATAAINTHVQRGWEWDFFPEWSPVERRAYRPIWNDSDTYAAGDEVFFEDDESYYTANSSPNTPAAGESPSTDTDKWTALTSFARYVSLDQNGLTPIGEVDYICRNDPTINPSRPGVVPFDITYLGIVPSPRAGARIYVHFRLRPPEFTTTAWDADTSYANDDVIYRPTTTGECYKAIAANSNQVPENNTASWVKVDFPYILARFVKHAAYADVLRGDDQTDKALAEDRRAETFLMQAHDVAFASQGQFPAATVSTY